MLFVNGGPVAFGASQRRPIPGACGSKTAKKILDGHLVDRQDPLQALHGNIRLSVFNPPILDGRQAVFGCKLLYRAITLLYSQPSQLKPDLFQGVVQSFLVHLFGSITSKETDNRVPTPLPANGLLAVARRNGWGTSYPIVVEEDSQFHRQAFSFTNYLLH
jgi:hypothetical protein